MSDEEYCDLETLEALLDEDNCDDESPTPAGDSLDPGISQEMKEFLDAMSEDSDDGEVAAISDKNKNRKLNNRVSSDSNNCDTNHDAKSGMGKKTSDASKSKDPMSEIKLRDKEDCKMDSSSNEDSTTQALQRELLMMQKKMEEMQKMLLAQQNKNSKTAEDRSEGTSCASQKRSSDSTKKLKLIMDDEEDPFFDRKGSSKPLHKQDGNEMNKVKSEKDKTLKVESKRVTSKEIFGDSDSDWDDLDGESRSTLSEQGKSIQRLLKAGQSERQAHKPNSIVGDRQISQQSSWSKQSADLQKKKECRESPLNTTVKEKEDKFALKCKSSSSDQSKPQALSSTQNERVVTEDFSRIRIINPLVSSAVMRMRMDARKLIHVSKIHSRLNTPDLQGDWVTIGAVVEKTNAKTSSTGKTYSIWRLNDLHELDSSVSFFLFGEVHKNHWKLDVGSVIGLLNPTMMESMEKGKSEPAFMIKNPNQLMILGQSKDLGWCLARTKKGNKCTHFINKNQGDFCSYHVQAEYKKTSAKRLELQGSVTGIKPKSFEQKIFSKNCAYLYGGQAFTPNNANAKLKKSVSLSKLQQNTNSPHRINTLSLNDIAPTKKTSSVGSNNRIVEEKDQLFVDMLSVPTPGSMNLVAHMKKKVTSTAAKSKSSNKSAPTIVMQSISATDLLKQHKQNVYSKKLERKRASDLLLASGRVSTSSSSCCDPLKQAPVLGKGLHGGQDISLDTSPPSRKSVSLSDKSKLKAISLIKNKGGISKDDPNAVRKQMDPKELDSIRKKTDDSNSKRSNGHSGQKSSAKPSSSSSNEDEPPKKRSRLLGDVDLNSSEVKAILKAKSKHKGALAEAEAEREETYFSELEKKERMEEKMTSITSIEISVYTCKQCKYTAQSALAECKTEQHTIVKTKTKKRFFACKKCKERTTTITSKFPTDACKKCGNLSYEKASMYKERSGPKLESEILSHRGDEMKFLNSLHHKVYLNTVVDK